MTSLPTKTMESIIGRIHLNSTRRLLLSRAGRFRVQNAQISFSTWQKSPEEESSKTKKNKKSLVDRISAAIDRFHERKLPPEIRSRPNAVRSETDLINIVERRIWHSMEEGQFENLPGKGKPLNLNSNPHADPAEDTLYRILSKNGFAPEWIELNKDIRFQITEWRKALRKVWTRRVTDGDVNWKVDSAKLQELLRDINNKVFRYNLIAPFGRQMCGLKWEKELEHMEHPDS
uniref:DnaJ homologue subfamily C member 28 conserved domain-containing protein n=1 Tax=Araucaria cunninghamii TaxID=56994 RepID=A0A0D6R8C1_ARACU